MEIIIGRDQQTRKLKVAIGEKHALFGQPNSVPNNVSRQHLSLTEMGDGKWRIKNLNDQNVTYVNGIPVESKIVSETDKVELGNSRYLFAWNIIKGSKSETVDISRLQRVWADYEEETSRIKNHNKTINNLSSIPMGLGLLGGLVSGISEELRTYALIFTGVSLTVWIATFFMRQSNKSESETAALKKELKRTYTCPKCGKFLGYVDYDILPSHCGNCKAKFRKVKS